MKLTAFVALVAFASATAARADASLLLASAGSSIGAEASAQLAHTPAAGLGVFASRWDSQDYGTLTGYGVRLGWNIYGPLGLDARASYLESKDERVDTTLIPLEAALTWRFRLGQYLAPYVGGGIGYYMKDAEINDAESWSSSENAAGYFALAGIHLHLGAFSLFAEGKYNLVGTDDDLHWRGADFDAQNSLDGLSYNFGLKLGF
jgi:opacity protein-like surface antigen